MRLLTASPIKRVSFFVSFDVLISIICVYLSYGIRFNFEIPFIYYSQIIELSIIITFLNITIFYIFNIYDIVWRYFSLYEAINISKALMITYVIVIVYSFFIDDVPKSIIVLSFGLSFMMFIYLRSIKRIFMKSNKDNAKRSLVLGVSDYISVIIKDDSYDVVGILDDDMNILNHKISNIKISPFIDLEQIIKSDKIECVILTKDFQPEIINNIWTMSSIYEFEIKKIDISENHSIIKNISIEDLLAREPKDLDKKQISEFIKDKTILITGAGGSIGSEIAKQCVQYQAKKLILLDMNEYNLYQISEHMDSINFTSFSPILLSITSDKINNIFENENIDIILHAAAYKHVHLVEQNIESAIINNIIGTKNIIDTALKYKIPNIVIISTDKAIRPTSIMGATKRICELYARNIHSPHTTIVSVRFGNVIGSSGSVIPKFQKQIENNEDITVTHKDVTRYFMLIKEACELVLQASSIGKGKEIFILNMGESVKIADLAQKMINLSGKKNISIRYIGLKKGEKLYEELIFDENDEKTKYNSIIIAKEKNYDINKLNQQIKDLLISDDKEKLIKKIIGV